MENYEYNQYNDNVFTRVVVFNGAASAISVNLSKKNLEDNYEYRALAEEARSHRLKKSFFQSEDRYHTFLHFENNPSIHTKVNTKFFTEIFQS